MSGKRAVIFGASGGIGSALALELAGRGFAVMAGSRSGEVPNHHLITPFRFDLTDEPGLVAAIQAMPAQMPDITIVATGALTLDGKQGPERSMKALDAGNMAKAFEINAIGPSLIARELLPRFARDQPCVFAVLSARVGSISDNQIGGWHSYRASKAALNMMIRNFAIELARTHPQAVIVGLHPGTVDTALSAPFQKNLPAGQLTPSHDAARNLLEVINRLGPRDSGHVFDWQGKPVPA